MARGGKKTNNTNVATEEVANKVVEEVKEENVTAEETVEEVKKVEEETQTVEDSVGTVAYGDNETVTEETISLSEDNATVSESDENKEEALEAFEGVECKELPEKNDKNPKEEEKPRLKHKVRYYEEVYGCNWNGQCFDY